VTVVVAAAATLRSPHARAIAEAFCGGSGSRRLWVLGGAARRRRHSLPARPQVRPSSLHPACPTSDYLGRLRCHLSWGCARAQRVNMRRGGSVLGDRRQLSEYGIFVFYVALLVCVMQPSRVHHPDVFFRCLQSILQPLMLTLADGLRCLDHDHCSLCAAVRLGPRLCRSVSRPSSRRFIHRLQARACTA
jgi:hypothetical protein